PGRHPGGRRPVVDDRRPLRRDLGEARGPPRPRWGPPGGGRPEGVGPGEAARADRRGGRRVGGAPRDPGLRGHRTGPGRGGGSSLVRPVARGEPGPPVRVGGEARVLPGAPGIPEGGGGGQDRGGGDRTGGADPPSADGNSLPRNDFRPVGFVSSGARANPERVAPDGPSGRIVGRFGAGYGPRFRTSIP